MVEWALSAVIGFVSGVLSGAFGIGGGILMVPGMRLLLDQPELVAVGTSLPVVIPSAITGASRYLKARVVTPKGGIILGLAGAPTAVMGAWLGTRVGGGVVFVVLSTVIVYAAADMVLQAIRGNHKSPAPPPAVDVAPTPDNLYLLAAIGAFAGIYSGFLGLGGGLVIVPLLIRFALMPVKRAIGTSLIAMLLIALPGTASHALLGNINAPLALGLALGIVPGALVGARITLGSSERVVKIGFAALLIVIAATLIFEQLSVAI
jgi:uncharacterized protein